MELNERITFEAARDSEEAFLQTGTWQSLSFEVKQRLGTRKLSARLSVLLGDLIKQKCVQIEGCRGSDEPDTMPLRLPDILHKLREEQRSVAAEIKKLPTEIKVRLLIPLFSSLKRLRCPQAAKSVSYTMGLVQKFANELCAHINPNSAHPAFRKELREIVIQLERQLL